MARDSHAAARRAARPDSAIRARERAAGRLPRRPEYWQRLLDLSVSYRVAVSWRGYENNARYLLQLEEPFDFAYNADPSALKHK
jgi:hypothetical protein